MGMFDRVWFKCSRCGAYIEEQSKAGPCTLKDYTPSTCPLEVAADLNGKHVTCVKCNHSHKVTVHAIITIDEF